MDTERASQGVVRPLLELAYERKTPVFGVDRLIASASAYACDTGRRARSPPRRSRAPRCPRSPTRPRCSCDAPASMQRDALDVARTWGARAAYRDALAAGRYRAKNCAASSSSSSGNVSDGGAAGNEQGAIHSTAQNSAVNVPDAIGRPGRRWLVSAAPP
jgi:hypothetical protein